MKKRRVEDAPPGEGHLRILKVIRGIRRGRVMTYGEVAAKAGLPGRARLVGFVLRSSPLAAGVPWHRVVSAGPRIALRAGACMDEQRRLLAGEGWEFTVGGRLVRA
jgi:methylated-DNA-protein-cysteine methyltransferase-like protein